MLNASDVAQFFIVAADVNQLEGITPLKLQKLLYYAQGTFVGLFGRPIFKDKIYKWKYGPVVDSVYDEYKRFGSSPISIPIRSNFNFPDKVSSHLIQVLYTYGKFSAIELSDMTHAEKPWKSAEMNEEISISSLQDFFEKNSFS